MPVVSWKTKTEILAGSFSGSAEVIGDESFPIITVFDQDISSADADIVADITAYILASYQVPVANQYPGDPNIYALISYGVPVDNQYPGDPTVYILVSYGVPVANQNPSSLLGDLVGFKSTGNFKTKASDMKISWVI